MVVYICDAVGESVELILDSKLKLVEENDRISYTIVKVSHV